MTAKGSGTTRAFLFANEARRSRVQSPTAAMTRIGFYSGSFDPVTLGHSGTLTSVLEMLKGPFFEGVTNSVG